MKCLVLSLSDVVFIMLINAKMPTIVGILTFMSSIKFVLSSVEHGKSFITSGLVFVYRFMLRICFARHLPFQQDFLPEMEHEVPDRQADMCKFTVCVFT